MRINKKYQYGQGMVGFLVVSIFFVVPAALGINYLARLGDAKHKSYEAARYATWERTVWHQSDNRYNRKSDIDISREINQRVFGRQERLLDSDRDRRRVDPSTIEYDPNLYSWTRERNHSRAPVIVVPNQQNAESNQLSIPDARAPGNFSGVINNIASTALGLDRNGFYNSRIQIELHKDAHFLESFDSSLGRGNPLLTTSNNAMLVGAWNANGPNDVRRTVRRTLPTTLLDNGVMDAIRTAASIAGFREFNRLDFGRVDAERVPCQRMTGRANGRGC